MSNSKFPFYIIKGYINKLTGSKFGQKSLNLKTNTPEKKKKKKIPYIMYI